MNMNMSKESMVKVGSALMAVGTVAAVAAGVVNSRNSTKSKMKRLAKKSAKVMDGVLDSMQYMFK